MRVLQVIAIGGAVGGGVWTVAEGQANALRAAGHDVTLLTGWMGTPPPDTADTKHFRVRKPFPGAGLRGSLSPRMVRAVVAAARTADIVHVHLARDFVTTAVVLRLVRASATTVVQTHGTYGPAGSASTRLFDRLFARRLDAAPAAWLALTGTEERNLIARGIPANRVVRISNAVPEASRSWTPPAVPMFSFISRLEERKQPVLFVEAALALLARGVQASFEIAGPDQGELARVRALIDGSSFAESFVVHPVLDRPGVDALLARSTATVLPARDEVYPMLTLEAAAAGVPLVLTVQSGVSALFAEHDAAELIEPTLEPLVAALQKLAGSPARARELSTNALALWRAQWTPARLVDQLIHAYDGATVRRGVTS